MSRAGALSLAATAAAAMLFFLIRHSLRTEESVQPFVRGLTDVELEWKCEAGHTFRAAGQVEPRRCWNCNQLAFPVRKFQCPVHGETDVWVKFERAPDGTPRPAAYRCADGEWSSAEQPPRCPRCQRELAPIRDDPVARLKSKRPRSAEPDGTRREP